MNCCSKHPFADGPATSSPSHHLGKSTSSMAVSTKFDIEFDDYSFGKSQHNIRSFVVSSEDDRQELEILDALSIVLTNQSLREARGREQSQQMQRDQEEQDLEQELVQQERLMQQQQRQQQQYQHPQQQKQQPQVNLTACGKAAANKFHVICTADTAHDDSNTIDYSSNRKTSDDDTFKSSGATTVSGVGIDIREPAAPRHGARICMSPADSSKEDFEMELDHSIAAAAAAVTPACAALSNLGLSLDDNDNSKSSKANSNGSRGSKDDEVWQFHTATTNSMTEEVSGQSLKVTQTQLRITPEQWKMAQRELEDNRNELDTIRQKAKLVKRQLKNFQKEWESQQNLMRNKDKELERLRLIIAERTLQLTEKTGELSITKVALVAAENGFTSCKKQVRSRKQDLEKVQSANEELKRLLSDSRAELSRTKLQLEASAQRRKHFSNQALRILAGEVDRIDPNCTSNTSGDDFDMSSKRTPTASNSMSPRLRPLRAKSWSFTGSSSASLEAMDENNGGNTKFFEVNGFPSFGSALPSSSTCSVLGVSIPSQGMESSGEPATPVQSNHTHHNGSPTGDSQSTASRGSSKRDHAISRPTRSRSKSRDARRDTSLLDEAKDDERFEMTKADLHHSSPTFDTAIECVSGGGRDPAGTTPKRTFPNGVDDSCHKIRTTQSEETTTEDETTTSSSGEDSIVSYAEFDSVSTGSFPVTATIMSIMSFVGWFHVWAMAEELGITYLKGQVCLADSRTILSSVSIVSLLAFMSMWTIVEVSWTTAYNMLCCKRRSRH
ncbi:expressed unknown protein [Seminavis robusta]|uniref:Uncharacterized protein n=1 Tax=Seminavis robusta TaxID=568900 RepID=A0A9N8HFQ5_9STRA|nr:expressed unknown protein [Seminavis robusta]|eukprot:Sro467_g149010.1 n/a (783) ;mRNA; f:60506-62947